MHRIARLAALAGALCLASGLSGRPFAIDDMLNAEAFGDIRVDPGGRWLVYAVARPLSQAPRIDNNAMDVIRSRLFVADLARPGPGRPLDPSDRKSGMVAFAFSPTGTRLAVGRLMGSRWQLGVVTMTTGAIRWTDVSIEYDGYHAMLDWSSENRIVAIAEGDGRPPFNLRADRTLFEELGANWRKQEVGRTPSVTVVGSGRLNGVTPHAADRKLMTISADDGQAQVLETGDLRSLDLSPDRRIAAISEQTTPFNLSADQVLSEKDQTRRHRLVLIDLATGGRTDVCARCDIRDIAPRWRGDSGAILFGGTADDARQADLTAWTFNLADREVTRVLPNALEVVDPVSTHGPTDLALGWAAGLPILFARPVHGAGGRFDWYRIGDGDAHCLTCSLSQVGAELIQMHHEAPVMMIGGDGWRLDANGATRASRSEGAIDLTSGGTGHAAGALLSWRRDGDWIDVTIRGAIRRHFHTPMVPGLSIVSGSATTGSLIGVRRFETGQAQILAFRQDQAPALIATINGDLEAVEAPDVVKLSHRHSDGTAATSWLLLPHGRSPGDKLPLVVIPYPGRVTGTHAPSIAAPDQLSDNPRPFIGHGFAVLLPDVPPVKEGSGGRYTFGADILAAVDAAIATGHVDPDKVGLYGHSFGGMTAVIVATQTDRFKAIVASAGLYDLVSQRGTFAPSTRLAPGEGQSMVLMGGLIETLQPKLGTTPWIDPAPYLASSAVFNADKIHTPMLIQAGDADAISLQQGEELFSALHRQGKDAELLSYWGEDHVLASPANVRDFHERMFDWFDCHFYPANKRCDGRPAPR
jgi:dipeptidyl aminopeptidase/acylaminoacyl peptidase